MSAHVTAQLLRFARVTGYALVAQLLLTGFSWPGWAGLWALVPGALETGLRQVAPVKAIPAVTSAPAGRSTWNDTPPPTAPPGSAP